MLLFRKGFFLATALLLLTEIVIAVWVHDQILRPYGGDFLAVILVYCFIRSFLATSVCKAALLALGVAYALEVLPLVHFLQHVGLQHSRLARVVFGNSFSWLDILLYTLGIAATLVIEKRRTGFPRLQERPQADSTARF